MNTFYNYSILIVWFGIILNNKVIYSISFSFSKAAHLNMGLIVMFQERNMSEIIFLYLGNKLIFYWLQWSWAKVIFLQAFVCPQGGGVSASVHAGICPHPPSRHQHHPPETESRIRSTSGPVCILLECILVMIVFSVCYSVTSRFR